MTSLRELRRLCHRQAILESEVVRGSRIRRTSKLFNHYEVCQISMNSPTPHPQLLLPHKKEKLGMVGTEDSWDAPQCLRDIGFRCTFGVCWRIRITNI